MQRCEQMHHTNTHTHRMSCLSHSLLRSACVPQQLREHGVGESAATALRCENNGSRASKIIVFARSYAIVRGIGAVQTRSTFFKAPRQTFTEKQQQVDVRCSVTRQRARPPHYVLFFFFRSKCQSIASRTKEKTRCGDITAASAKKGKKNKRKKIQT